MMDQNDFLHGHDQFAELCAALYERALHDLSWNGPDNAVFLKRRLASLPFYVRRAAHALLTTQLSTQQSKQQDSSTGSCPLQLDFRNASWHARQAAKPPAGLTINQTPDTPEAGKKIEQWLRRHARLGLVLPIQVEQEQLYGVYLDSIDRVELQPQHMQQPAVHLNRYGWFGLDGQPLEEQHARLLKPSRSTMSAACCGHQWSAAGRKAPRTLSLREVLLATTLQWPRFTQVRALPE